ncbi:DUF1128 domain-containing protein [Bacillaceae bacterium W0354]
MNLNEATQENLKYIIDDLTKSLQVLNPSVMNAEHYDLANYDDIKDLYEMVKNKGNISVPEIHAIIDELKKLRKK